MRMPRPVLLLLLVLALLFMGSAQTAISPEQSRLFDLVNQERQKQGLPKLQWDDHLAQSAEAHNRLVIARDELSHQFPGEPPLGERVGSTGLRFNAAGENLAYAPTVEEVHTGLMNSPPHRANILDPKFNSVGISIVKKEDELYVVQNFAHVLPGYSEDQFRDAVVAAFQEQRHAAKIENIDVRSDPRLHEAACGKNPNPNVVIREVPGATDLVVFTSSVPEKLPAQMKRLAGDRTVKRMNIGVCFRPGKEHGYGSFSVVAAFFPVT